MTNSSKPGSVAAIVVAAGRGTRAGGDNAGGVPKQYRHVAGRPVLEHSVRTFQEHPDIGTVLVVIGEEDHDAFAALDLAADVRTVTGGTTRQESVLAGLQALTDMTPQSVLIHDAARPFVTTNLVDTLLTALLQTDGAIPLLPLIDTIKRTAEDGHILETLDRRELGAAQTPQVFHFEPILEAHQRARDETEALFTDDAAVGMWGGLTVGTVEGDPNNFKLTTPADFERAEQLSGSGKSMETRTGMGFDVHRFEPGASIVLGGVTIPFDKTLSGHSDADVLMHAITDALLGAIGDGDIGTHFPPSDEAWKGADSAIFLRDAILRVKERGGMLVNIDATVMCEAPKIGPHREAICARLAEIMGVEPDRISIKATTTERLGFTGRGEGIATSAVATVRVPE